MSKKKIGFLGGTFDPPHFGHINFSLEMQEKHQLDKILLCPAGIPPHKTVNAPIASPGQRLDMVTLAFEGVKGVEVINIEVKKTEPCYTIDTIRALHEKYAQKKEDVEFFLLLAEDAALGLASWKDSEELLTLATLIVGSRNLPVTAQLEKACDEKILKRVQKAKTQILEMGIASTYVRERLKNGLYCGHLVPQKVLDYIHKNKIYK